MKILSTNTFELNFSRDQKLEKNKIPIEIDKNESDRGWINIMQN